MKKSFIVIYLLFQIYIYSNFIGRNIAEIKFRVNLKPIGNTLLSDAEAEKIAISRTMIIPGRLGGTRTVYQHGDEFTLTGPDAIYLRNLIRDQAIEIRNDWMHSILPVKEKRYSIVFRSSFDD